MAIIIVDKITIIIFENIVVQNQIIIIGASAKIGIAPIQVMYGWLIFAILSENHKDIQIIIQKKLPIKKPVKTSNQVIKKSLIKIQFKIFSYKEIIILDGDENKN